MKVALFLASILTSAAAFVTTKNSLAKPLFVGTGGFENDIGVLPPAGYWDPLNLLSDADEAKFNRLRSVELKHGRVSQLAFLGFLTTWSGIRLPGLISKSQNLAFADIPGGHDAVFVVPKAGLIQILLFAGFLELYGFRQAEGSFPGDFSASPFPVGWVGADDENTRYELRQKELNNGRAAMMGILAVLAHEQLDGKPFIFFDPSV